MASANNEKEILDFIIENPRASSTEVEQGLKSMALATIKRGLKRLVADNHILVEGKGKATRYLVSPAYELIRPINVAEYFTKEIDERIIKTGFNHELITAILANSTIFTKDENEKLQNLQS